MEDTFKLLPLTRTAQSYPEVYGDSHFTKGLESVVDDPAYSHDHVMFDLKKEDENILRPGLFQSTVLHGFLALCITLLCTIGSIVVLRLSDGKSVSSWSIQPTVWLALASAVGNSSLKFAFSQGVTISWWEKVLGGGTLRELHQHWDYGTSVLASLSAGRNTNLIAIASIVVSGAIIDGSLLQRASSVRQRTIQSSVPIAASIAPQLPKGYTAVIQSLSEYPSILNIPFVEVMQDYTNRVPITSGFEGCDGECSLAVRAAGLAVNCVTTTIPLDYNENNNAYTNGTWADIAYENFPAFSVHFEWLQDTDDQGVQQTFVSMIIGYANTVDCVGTFITNTCTLKSAVVAYQIDIRNTTVTLNNPSTNLTVVAISNNTGGEAAVGDYTTLGGIALAAQDLFATNTTVRPSLGNWQESNLSTFANQYYKNRNSLDHHVADLSCPSSWSDPTDDILAALNNIMFRTALKAATVNQTLYPLEGNFPINSTIKAIQTTEQNVYQSNMGYLYAAIGILQLGVLIVAPVFYGWWKLGRKYTMSPIEVANAFSAPVLSGTTSGADVRQLLREAGHRRIRVKVRPMSHKASEGPSHSNTGGEASIEPCAARLESPDPGSLVRPERETRFET